MNLVLRFSILALTSTGFIACVSSGSDDKADTDGSADSSSTTTTGSTSSGGASSTTDTSSSTTGAAGAVSEDCMSPVVITTPMIGDFEDYDGAMAGVDYSWSFNEDGLGFGGFWLHSDEADDNGMVPEDGGYTLNFIAGANGSTYAISGQDTEADDWGGGVGIYTKCMDASSFTGIQFMVSGSTPNGTFDMSINTDGEQSFSSGDLTMPSDWEQVQVPFASMTAAEENTVTSTNGSLIVSIVFSAHLVWVEDLDAADGTWVATPGPFELTIDDISFY